MVLDRAWETSCPHALFQAPDNSCPPSDARLCMTAQSRTTTGTHGCTTIPEENLKYHAKKSHRHKKNGKSKEDTSHTTVLRLCVCNLLTDRRDLLPPLDGDNLIEDAIGGSAVLTVADHADGLHRPVLLAGVCRKDLQVHLARLSSDSASASQTWSWNRIPGLVSGS
ncbi:hypothetical protein EJB05_03151, partial [Eragrostis curvula]